MTAEREEPGQRNWQKLDDIVQDVDEYYNVLVLVKLFGTGGLGFVAIGAG